MRHRISQMRGIHIHDVFLTVGNNGKRWLTFETPHGERFSVDPEQIYDNEGMRFEIDVEERQ